MNKDTPIQFRALAITACIVIAAFIITTSVQHSFAAAATWTSDADFGTWNHFDTTVANNSVSLSKVVTYQTLGGNLSQPVIHGGAYFDAAASNKLYVIGGTGPEGGAQSLAQDTIQMFTSTPDSSSAPTINHMPQRRRGSAVVYSILYPRAYIIGGANTLDQNDPNPAAILEYNKSSPNIPPAPLPTQFYADYSAAVLDPTLVGTDEILIFGGHNIESGDGTPLNQIYRYKPGVPSLTQIATLPYPLTETEALWSAANNKVYLIGGRSDTQGYEDRIIEFDPATNTSTILASRLPVPLKHVQITYNTLNNKIYFFGEGSTNLFEFNPTSKAITTLATTLTQGAQYGFVGLNTATNVPFIFGGSSGGITGIISKLLFNENNAMMGYATKVFTPATGQINDWTSATAGITSNSGSITMLYTDNPDCTTGLTSDITVVPNSESLCIRANLTTTSPTSPSPTLNDVTINYNIFSTPSPSPSSSATPCAMGIPFPTPYPVGIQSPTPAPNLFASPTPGLPTPTPTPFGTSTPFTPTPTPTPSFSSFPTPPQ